MFRDGAADLARLLRRARRIEPRMKAQVPWRYGVVGAAAPVSPIWRVLRSGVVLATSSSRIPTPMQAAQVTGDYKDVELLMLSWPLHCLTTRLLALARAAHAQLCWPPLTSVESSTFVDLSTTVHR